MSSRGHDPLAFSSPGRRSLLHIGCGPKRKDQTLPAFQSDDWREVRFDIDESVAPDIIGTMADTSAVETGSMDAVLSSPSLSLAFGSPKNGREAPHV